MFPFRRALLGAVLSVTAACGAEKNPNHSGPPSGAPDGSTLADAGDLPTSGADGGLDSGAGVDPHCGFVTGKLDLLFVVDNSISMEAEQLLLARELPRMVRALASGDVNGDGEQDHPAGDLRVGVVSTDMGVSGELVSSTIGCSHFGDDAVLRNPSACPLAPHGYLAFEPDTGGSPEAFADAVACQIQLGTKGCGMEQQLEAALKALAPGAGPLRFVQGTLGHGDGANAGFLRDDATLAIVIVTDEDDCSYPETTLGITNTEEDGPFGDIPVNYRCQAKPELLHPITRYTEALPALRGGAPGSVVFGLIAGIPPELTLGAHDIDAMLADPSMQFVLDESRLTPMPACTITRSLGSRTETVTAIPARRLLEVAKAFGEHAVVGSICEPSFEQPVAALAKRIGGVLACPDDPIVF